MTLIRGQAFDFDILVQRLRDLKAGKRAEIPVYSFAEHARLDRTTTIYSPHVLILEGIFALHDPRILELLDMAVCPPVKQVLDTH
jgi:uridine kinase